MKSVATDLNEPKSHPAGESESAPGSAPPSNPPPKTSQSTEPQPAAPKKSKKKHHWLRRIGYLILFVIIVVVIARPFMPRIVRWYVVRAIDQNPLYQAQIGDIDIHLYRGAYTIDDLRLLKTTGDVPVPFIYIHRMDLAIQWNTLIHGKIVGRIRLDEPQVNFVASKSDDTSQDGSDEPWLAILRSLFPFKINSLIVNDGSIHFRTYQADAPVDVYLSNLRATCDNFTNVYDETTPLNATINATAKAMDQADFELKMKIDPFSYRPTFQIALRLIGLDVRKTNLLVRKYGGFDFEKGWFDLVVEIDANEGALNGYVKPLFRDLQVFGLADFKKDKNPLELFWEALVGVTTDIFKNQPRNQLGTLVPFTGSLNAPSVDYLATLGNVLRNAFIRAYLPRFQGNANDISPLNFSQGSIMQEISTGNDVGK